MRTVPPTRHAALILFACIATAPTFAVSQRPLRPGRLPREVRQALRLGVMSTFESASGNVRDTRHDRLLALHVPADRPPTPFLPAGPFKVTMETYVRLRLKGEYRFSAEGRGSLRLSLNDKPVFARSGDLGEQAPVTVALIKGYNTLRLDYVSPASGDATFRLYWQSDEIPREPIPTTQIHCNSASPALNPGLEPRQSQKPVPNRTDDVPVAHQQRLVVDDLVLPGLETESLPLDGVPIESSPHRQGKTVRETERIDVVGKNGDSREQVRARQRRVPPDHERQIVTVERVGVSKRLPEDRARRALFFVAHE